MGRLRRLVRRVLATNADAFVDAGTLSREYLQTLIPAGRRAPFFRSYNCVDGSLFSSGSANDSGSKSGPPFRRILFVGRLNQNKGIPMLLEVYRDLLENSGDAIGLVLAGEGPLREIVEEFQRSHKSASIEMLGQVPYDQMVRYYRECDVFVLLSLSDCNPLVIFEALHAGIPIVCSENAGNAPDFIVPGQNGYIVNPEDRDSIVSCLLDVLKWDAARRTECARVSREQVKMANYKDSAAAFIEACKAVYRE
ncbi:MAG: glycosyltransferase family 4 protein [Planctomycetota bacterium]